MSALDLAVTNLTSPVFLAFALGIVATFVRSDLRLPEALVATLSVYLLLAIGLKGGKELATAGMGELWLPALVTVAIGVIVPLAAYLVVRRAIGLTAVDAAAVAAHYGSTSAVTFTAGLAFLQAVDVPYEGFVTALLAVLEVPAIAVALWIGKLHSSGGEKRIAPAMREVVAGTSILLLVGGIVIGAAAGPERLEPVAPVFEDGFRGALVLFMLELGMLAARRFGDLRSVGLRLTGFAIGFPLLAGTMGVALGTAAGLSLGGSTILGILTASASYIAAPAAVRVALPEANPGIYLTASLGVTFPFNLAVGIPVYYAVAQVFH